MKYLLSLSLVSSVLSFTACKKDGTPVEYPGFGSLQVQSNASTPTVETFFILQVDGQTLDTLGSAEDYIKTFPLKTGDRYVSIIDASGKTVYTDTLQIELQKLKQFPSLLIQNENLLVNDYDPAVIKPAPGNMLARFIVTDPALPELLNIRFSVRYTSNSTGVSTFIDTEKEVKNISKTKFSEYIELTDPVSFDPDGYSHTYVFEGWNAATGEKVMDFTGRTYGFMRYGLGNLPTYQPDNVITMEIPASATGTTHIGKVLFQTTL